MDAFAVGAAIPLFNLKDIVNKKHHWLSFFTVLLVLIGLVNLFFLDTDVNQTSNLTVTSLGYPIGGMKNMQHIWSYTVLNLWAGALILYVATARSVEHQQPNLLIKLLENRWIVTIGKISYGMYVYHWVVFVMHKKFLHDFLGNTIFSFFVYFMIVFAISYVSFYFFERKFLAWKDRLTSPLAHKPG